MPTVNHTMDSMKTTGQRFMEKIDVRRPGECWPWLAAINKHPVFGGYGAFWIDGKVKGAHIVMYERTYGPVPPGMTVDHTCHNASGCRGVGPECPHKRCCNPLHLEAVTHAENLRRGNKRVPGETCGRGHTKADGFRPDGRNVCLACMREKHAKRVSDPEGRSRYNARKAAELRRRRAAMRGE